MDKENTVVSRIKNRIRVKAETSDQEVSDLIHACEQDLKMNGVYGDESDPLYYQVMVLYCKAHYGYDDKTDRFLEAYQDLRDSMALSGDYQKKEEPDGSGTGMDAERTG